MVAGVVVDANVLHSRTLRDWLLMLRNASDGDLFTVYATEDILAETIASFRRRYPEASGRQVARLRRHLVDQLDELIEDFHVDGSYPGPDAKDAHVHAAAIASEARYLVTDDGGWHELDPEVLDALPYEAHTADSFLILIDDHAPYLVRQVLSQQVRYWLGRDGACDMPSRLRGAACPRFAVRVEQHSAFVDDAGGLIEEISEPGSWLPLLPRIVRWRTSRDR